MPKLEKRLPKHVLTAAEADRVLNQANVDDPLGLRDRAIMETFYSTGIRRLELLQPQALRPRRGARHDDGPQGQGQEGPHDPHRRAGPGLDRPLHHRGPARRWPASPTTACCSYSNQGEAFSPNRLTQLVREYVAAAEIGKSGSCHLFRHTMATLMLEGGADIRFIQQMLGHVKLDTTQIYTQVSIRKLKEIHTLTHPGRPIAAGARATPAADIDTLLDTLDREAEEERG